MLVLTREVGDSIFVGEDVIITVLDMRSNQVRLGIQAPIEVVVDRAEIRRAKLRELEGRHRPGEDRP